MAIRRLSQQLVSHIAAGEVVERPASVLKELVENSLDAGADRLQIEVEKAGVKQIRVCDNGSGIAKEDLPLAVARYATSKILSLVDLDGITTMGFRGEALASIAAVSQLALTSCARGQQSGWKFGGNAGESESVDPTPAAHPVGTTVEVRELFYNAPVRRKFLRTERTEFVRLERVVKQIALSHFEVEIQFHHNRRPVIMLPRAHSQQQRERRLGELCGQVFVKQALYIDVERGGMRLWGWFGVPGYSRSHGDLQYCFVNHRMVRDPLISHAVRQAYQDVLYHGRYPVFVLNLLLNPAQVDVNIHPTKQEIRFRDPHVVHEFIVYGVKERLANVKENSLTLKVSAEQGWQDRIITSTDDAMVAVKMTSGNEQEPLCVQEQGLTLQTAPAAMPMPDHGLSASTRAQLPPLGYALAQLCASYVLAENATGLVMVDIRSARERIAYERFKTSLAQEGIHSRPLLLPVTLDINQDQARLLDHAKPALVEFGLDIALIGPKTAVIRQIPFLLDGVDAARLLHDVLTDLAQYGNSFQFRAALHRTLARAACAEALDADRRLTLFEMNKLLRDLEQSENDGNRSGDEVCEQRRLPWVQFDRAELNKLFESKP